MTNLIPSLVVASNLWWPIRNALLTTTPQQASIMPTVARDVSLLVSCPFTPYLIESSTDLATWTFQSVSSNSFTIILDCEPKPVRFWRITPIAK